MIRKSKILELIAQRTDKRKESSFRTLVREFDLSEEAACAHLRRLWRAHLIEATSFRPLEYEFQTRRGESIRDLRFVVAKEGRERLAWWAKQDRKARPGWPF